MDHWSGGAGVADFFDASGLAELFAQAAGCAPHDLSATVDDDLPWFVRGRRARLSIATTGGPVLVGWAGQVRPDIISARGLDAGAVLGGEIDLAALGIVEQDRHTRQLAPIPRFPSIVRDLSIVVPERLPAADVRGTIRSTAPDTLAAVGEFDRYAGKGVPDGHVSISVRLTFRHADRTLTDVEVQQAVDRIVRSLEANHGAVLRGK
jgi:phenylalanyl-tRNA synthetase beta chain